VSGDDSDLADEISARTEGAVGEIFGLYTAWERQTAARAVFNFRASSLGRQAGPYPPPASRGPIMVHDTLTSAPASPQGTHGLHCVLGSEGYVPGRQMEHSVLHAHLTPTMDKPTITAPSITRCMEPPMTSSRLKVRQ
jgi:hypothetical protein